MRISKVIVSILFSAMIVCTFHSGAAADTGNSSGVDKGIGIEKSIVSTVDINNAGTDILITLPGIGPKTADKIDEYRKVNGPFKTVDDLLNIKGIGPKVLEKIRPLVRVS